MGYKEHGMWEVLEVLRRAHRGEGRRAIARTTGRTRKTVTRYLEAAQKLGWQPGDGEPGEPLAARILAQLRPGPRDHPPSEAEQRLWVHRETLRAWLSGDTADRRPLTLTKCHDLLGRRGVAVTYSSLYRFAVKHCGFGDRATTVRVATVAPGELAEIDFGRLGLIRDGLLERRRVLWALVVTLVHSRHQYVHLTRQHFFRGETFLDRGHGSGGTPLVRGDGGAADSRHDAPAAARGLRGRRAGGPAAAGRGPL